MRAPSPPFQLDFPRPTRNHCNSHQPPQTHHPFDDIWKRERKKEKKWRRKICEIGLTMATKDRRTADLGSGDSTLLPVRLSRLRAARGKHSNGSVRKSRRGGKCGASLSGSKDGGLRQRESPYTRKQLWILMENSCRGGCPERGGGGRTMENLGQFVGVGWDPLRDSFGSSCSIVSNSRAECQTETRPRVEHFPRPFRSWRFFRNSMFRLNFDGTRVTERYL